MILLVVVFGLFLGLFGFWIFYIVFFMFIGLWIVVLFFMIVVVLVVVVLKCGIWARFWF